MLRYHVHWMSALAIVLLGAVATGIASPVPQPIKIPRSEILRRSKGRLSVMEMLEMLDWEESPFLSETYQSSHGLDITSALDDELGPPEVEIESETRSKRKALYGSRWNVTDLTYQISKYSKQLDRSAVDKEIARAFGIWSEHTDLTFTPKETGNVDIEIRFEEGKHCDAPPFDGPNGKVAHSSFPNLGGDVHFDDAEQWTSNTSHGVNLFQVAVHQFGHSLGLHHSEVKSSVMSTLERNEYDPNFRLDSDDIEVIQALYGPKTSSLSYSAKIDAKSYDGNTYVYKGDRYNKLKQYAKKTPAEISEEYSESSSDE